VVGLYALTLFHTLFIPYKLKCMPDLSGLYLARIASADCFSLDP
jgi:hypothetical protein